MERVVQKPNILLVDDRPENLLALRAVLSSQAYNLIEASSGEEALRYMLDLDFALILMDIQMPGMDGFETAMMIKKRTKTQFVPLIFITASFMEDADAQKGYQAGAVDYIRKPYDPEALRAKVNFFADYFKKNKKNIHQSELEEEHRRVIEVVSHDLRNPLAALDLNLRIIKEMVQSFAPPDDLGLDRKFTNVEKSADLMRKLIEDLLDLARIDGTQVHLMKSSCDIREIINEAVESMEVHAESKNISVHVRVDKDCAKINCDKERLLQVFFNLLGNAIKFTPPKGSVVIDVYPRGVKTIFKVQDTGMGIPKEYLDSVFDRFWINPESPKNSGTGLGLSIAKWIVEAHEGRMWVESDRGEGATFYFEI